MPKVSQENRCLYIFPKGRQCRYLRSYDHPSLCVYHAEKEKKRKAKESGDIAVQLFGPVQEFYSALSLTEVLGRLLLLQACDRIPPRKAAVMTYTCQLLLQAQRANKDDCISFPPQLAEIIRQTYKGAPPESPAQSPSVASPAEPTSPPKSTSPSSPIEPPKPDSPGASPTAPPAAPASPPPSPSRVVEELIYDYKTGKRLNPDPNPPRPMTPEERFPAGNRNKAVDDYLKGLAGSSEAKQTEHAGVAKPEDRANVLPQRFIKDRSSPRGPHFPRPRRFIIRH